MQLVVMVAVLALAGAGWDCNSNCHLTSMRISVESCNKSESFYTTVCEGQCFNTDPVYIGPQDWPKQNICDGDWSYEMKHIEGCPVGVTYPVATSCRCTLCNPDGNTDCEPYPGHITSCMPEL